MLSHGKEGLICNLAAVIDAEIMSRCVRVTTKPAVEEDSASWYVGQQYQEGGKAWDKNAVGLPRSNTAII
jgi:hypothetical protein